MKKCLTYIVTQAHHHCQQGHVLPAHLAYLHDLFRAFRLETVTPISQVKDVHIRPGLRAEDLRLPPNKRQRITQAPENVAAAAKPLKSSEPSKRAKAGTPKPMHSERPVGPASLSAPDGLETLSEALSKCAGQGSSEELMREIATLAAGFGDVLSCYDFLSASPVDQTVKPDFGIFIEDPCSTKLHHAKTPDLIHSQDTSPSTSLETLPSPLSSRDSSSHRSIPYQVINFDFDGDLSQKAASIY